MNALSSGWGKVKRGLLGLLASPSDTAPPSITKRRLRRGATMLDTTLAILVGTVSAGAAAYFLNRGGWEARTTAIAAQMTGARNAVESYILGNLDAVTLETGTSGGGPTIGGSTSNRWVIFTFNTDATGGPSHRPDLVVRGVTGQTFRPVTIHNHRIYAAARHRGGPHGGCTVADAASQAGSRCLEVVVYTVPLSGADGVERGEAMQIASRVGVAGGAFLAAGPGVPVSQVYGMSGSWTLASSYFTDLPAGMRPTAGSLVVYFGVGRTP